MEQNFRRLLPRRSSSPLTKCNEADGDRSVPEESNWGAAASSSGRRPPRSVRAACESCRRQKCKCDGKRPTCSHCLRQRTECTYITDSGETRFSALRRRYSSQEEELESLKKILHHIRTSPPEEVVNIVARIRSCDDPIEAFNSYFSSANGPSPATEPETETGGTSGLHIDPRLGSLSETWSALGNPIHVEAFPWTTVASSDVVSHLISQYFILEHPVLLPPIHYHDFTDEMNKGDIISEVYCSDLLVNAICAQQCFLSHPYTRGSIINRELGRKFLHECYRLLQLRTGRIALPTAQAVTLIYQAELADHVFNDPPAI
ncbi:hypothetical protein E4U41_002518 [Claviceps citrina]|nr:hypothetical protein E4U41_002518 [Claviceps citrina]